MNPNIKGSYIRSKQFFLNISDAYRERADIKAYLEILLSLVTVSIFAVFALKPTIVTIAELIKQIQNRQDLITRMDKKIQDLSDAQVTYDQQINNINLLNSVVPSNAEPDVLLRQIQNLTNKDSVSLQTLTLNDSVIFGSKIKAAENVQKADNELQPLPDNASGIPFSVTVMTTPTQYVSMANFLNDFVGLRLPVQIENFNLTNTKVDQEDKLSLTIQGQIPYLPSVTVNNQTK